MFPYFPPSPKASIGDDVDYNGHAAKILRFDSQKDSVEIEFKDHNLIPPTMWVPLQHVKTPWGHLVVNPRIRCPKCDVPWKETMLARFSVWDCPQCGAKKEDHCS